MTAPPSTAHTNTDVSANAFRAHPSLPLFALGCFERRVTIYSQQVRALTLSRALVEEGILRRTGRVAIVGGGIGGVTLAAALSAAAPEAKVTLLEAKDRLMHLQQGGRDRFVHPHIFDWPSPSAGSLDAGLPLMNWQAGPANEVVATLAETFKTLRAGKLIEVSLKTEVTGIVELGGALKIVAHGAVVDELFDAVVLSIGFGLEKHLSAECPSYWSPSRLPAPLLTSDPHTDVFISGNGDGGLADFALAAFNGEALGDILQGIVGHPDVAPLIDPLMALDEQAWLDRGFDLYSAYQTQIRPLLSRRLLLDLHDQLRPAVRVVMHTPEAQLLRRETALLNRLVTFLALAADAHFSLNHLRVETGRPLIGDILHGPLHLDGGASYQANLRLMRFGPDRETVQRPFAPFIAATAATAALSTVRPSTPVLTEDLAQWYLARLPKTTKTVIAAVPATTKDASGTLPLPTQAEDKTSAPTQINVVGGNVGEGATVTQIYTGPDLRRR